MTTQQQTKKQIIWSKILTAALGVFSTVLIWFGNWQVKVYNATLLQPRTDQQQTSAIVNIISEMKELKSDVAEIKNEQTRQGGKIIYLEAIMPDKNQFKVK